MVLVVQVRWIALLEQDDHTVAARGGGCHPSAITTIEGTALTTVDTSRPVIGGVDTHLDVNVAAALDPIGGLLGVAEFATSAAGNDEMLGWLLSFGPVARIGVEGTGAYGAGLARFLRRSGIEVLEVDRPNRQARRRQGKSDTVDAIEAARAAQANRQLGLAKTRDGNVEAIRALVVAKRSAKSTKVKSLNQIRHLGFTAPEPIRQSLHGLSPRMVALRCAAMRPRERSETVTFATKTALATLGRRVLALDAEIDHLDKLLAPLVARTAPQLLEVFGIGTDTAAALLITAGDNPDRLRSESAWAHLCGVAPIPASSGKTVRWRLNRGGDRQANAALWRIVICRMSNDPRTRAYVARRVEEGLSKGEIIRVLKRYVARQIYPLLPRT
jgi:transposase